MKFSEIPNKRLSLHAGLTVKCAAHMLEKKMCARAVSI